jgi:hypothetical protein
MNSPVVARVEQISREIEKTNRQLESKTQRHFKTEQSFRQWQRKQFDKIAELEDELRILKYPEDYAELPVPLIADELGIKSSDVNHLIDVKEIFVSRIGEYTKQKFINRDELGRILDFGVENLLERGQQEPEDIFAEAVDYLHSNNWEKAERAYERLASRDSNYSIRAESLETVINLLKGNLEDVLAVIRANFKYSDLGDLTVYLTYLGRLVRGMNLEEHGAQALAEQILSITEKQTLRLYDRYEIYKSKQIGKQMDDLQKRAMFLTTAIIRALRKYKFVQQFKRYNERYSEMRDEEFQGIIRNAIYTALRAEDTYEESEASKMFVDILISEIPRWYAPADPVEHLP